MPLTPPNEALEAILTVPIPPARMVTKSLWDAALLVLAEDVITPRDIPPFNRSAMDGFAIRSSDTSATPDSASRSRHGRVQGSAEGLPDSASRSRHGRSRAAGATSWPQGDRVALRVVGTREAGDNSLIGIKQGECVRIMTGAALPEDADAVVPFEEAVSPSPSPDGVVEVPGGVAPWTNVARRGEDAKMGAVVLRSGTMLDGPGLAAAAGVGCGEVAVHPLPTVAFLQTGGELVEPGKPVGPHQIYNSNSYLLHGLLLDGALGIPKYLGTCRDEKDLLASAIRTGLESDVLLMTGGVSKGDFDYVPEVLGALGVSLVFRGLALRPGRPLLFGVSPQGRFVFGLPGNPNGSLVCFKEYVVPLLRRLSRAEERPGPVAARARLASAIRKKPGRWFYEAATLRFEDGELAARPLSVHGSGHYLGVLGANGVVVLPGDSEGAEAGEEVDVHVWNL